VRRPIAAAAAALLLIALAGCGEKDEPATTGPVVTAETSTTTSTGSTTQATTTTTEEVAKTPADAVEAFLVSPDAELVCDEQVTPKFLRASYGDRAGCIAARKPATLATAPGLNPANGNVVTAQPQGGIYDGEKLTFTTVPAGGGVAIDSVKSNAPVGP
jgi:hypothetical protein